MSKDLIVDALGLIDDEFILETDRLRAMEAEAKEERKVKTGEKKILSFTAGKGKLITRLALVAACICLVVVGAQMVAISTGMLGDRKGTATPEWVQKNEGTDEELEHMQKEDDLQVKPELLVRIDSMEQDGFMGTVVDSHTKLTIDSRVKIVFTHGMTISISGSEGFEYDSSKPNVGDCGLEPGETVAVFMGSNAVTGGQAGNATGAVTGTVESWGTEAVTRIEAKSLKSEDEFY